MALGKKFFATVLFGCLLLSGTAFALTTNVVPGQDISFRDCAGQTFTSTDRALAIYGASCMNAFLRFDLRVLGAAGLANTQSITLDLPVLNAVSGMDLQASYVFSASPLSWNELSSVAALSSAFDGQSASSASATLVGQGLAQITLTLPANLGSNAVLEVRLSTNSDSSSGIDAAQVVQVGSRRQSEANQRARARVLMQESCTESAVAPTSCLSAAAFGISGENAGFCIGGSTGFCDCHSGMYGANCALNATSNPQCTYADWGRPVALATNFPPLVARDVNGVKSNRYENNRLILNIESPLVQRRSRTELYIGNPASANYPGQAGCRYPGYFWNKEVKSASADFTPANNSLSCVESYTAAIPWGTALSCGWTQDNAIKPGFTTYRSVITVQHTEHLPALRGAAVERNLQHIIPIQVAFPKTVVVSTNVTVFSFVNLQAAIVAQKVLLPGQNGVDTPSGRLVLATSLQWPFALTNFTFEDLATGERFTFSIDNPHPTSEGSFTEDCLAQAAAGNPNPICNQLFGHFMLPLPNTCDLNGNYRYTFGVECRGPANLCPLGGPNDVARTAFVDVQLKSEDFCAQIEIDIDARGTLRVFSDNTYTTPKSAFLFENSGPAQRAFFRADVSSDKATISQAWIEAVAVYPSTNPDNRFSLYTKDGGAVSAAYNFATTDGIDFALFDVDVIPASFPGVDVDANIQFSVEAVVGIEFEQPTFGGSKKRGVQYKTYTFDRRAVSAVDTKQQTAAAVAQIGLSAPRLGSAPSSNNVAMPVASQQGGQQGTVTSGVSAVVASFSVVAASIALLAVFGL